jgi:pilus assembly protein CpaC
LPSFTVRNAETTIQLNDGQSFAIAGLIKNNVTETVKRYPVLGEVPIIGALFRSSEFQNDRTELLFVVTPRLVKPLPPNYALPTDSYRQPSRAGFFLGGQMEGSAPSSETSAEAPAAAAQPQPAGGFETR